MCSFFCVPTCFVWTCVVLYGVSFVKMFCCHLPVTHFAVRVIIGVSLVVSFVCVWGCGYVHCIVVCVAALMFCSRMTVMLLSGLYYYGN